MVGFIQDPKLRKRLPGNIKLGDTLDSGVTVKGPGRTVRNSGDVPRNADITRTGANILNGADIATLDAANKSLEPRNQIEVTEFDDGGVSLPLFDQNELLEPQGLQRSGTFSGIEGKK